MPISVVIQDAVGGPPDVDDAATWADGLGLTYPVLADVDGEVFEVYNPDVVLPLAYLVDRDGVVAWGEAGGTGNLDEIRDRVDALLAR